MYMLSAEKYAAQILDEISSFSYSASVRRPPHTTAIKNLEWYEWVLLITYTVEKTPLLG